MKRTFLPVQSGFPKLLKEINARIQQAQTRAILAANAELVSLYWDIGRMIGQRQRRAGWGAGVIPRLARELRNELPEVKGFSERNIKLMVQFAHEYPDAFAASPAIGQLPVAQLPVVTIGQPAVAQLPVVTNGQLPVAQIPWAHNVLLMQRVKEPAARLWYMQQTLVNGWSRDFLLVMIKSEAHRRQGTALTNFNQRLPAPQSDLARQTLKDPYIFDFLTMEEPFHERELETNLLRQLERFLLELGQGFAFVGRQLHLEVGGSEFYIDLLFYHLKLRCFVVIDLKKGEFKPEYTGKMNFYLSVVDDQLRHEYDAPSVGLILCQDRNHIVAEYALRGVTKPIGISEYELTRALPPILQSALPTVDEIEAELAGSEEAGSPKPTKPKPTRPARKKQPKQKRKK
jgi:predicted nuclease of restriction endonuclease-like (RecB) superfamily